MMKKRIAAAAAVLFALTGAAYVYAHDVYEYVNEYFAPIPPEGEYGTIKSLQGDFRQNEIGEHPAEAIWTKGKLSIRKPDGSAEERSVDVAGFGVIELEWDGANNGNPLTYHKFGTQE